MQLEMHVCTNVTVQKWDLIFGSVPKEGLQNRKCLTEKWD